MEFEESESDGTVLIDILERAKKIVSMRQEDTVQVMEVTAGSNTDHTEVTRELVDKKEVMEMIVVTTDSDESTTNRCSQAENIKLTKQINARKWLKSKAGLYGWQKVKMKKIL